MPGEKGRVASVETTVAVTGALVCRGGEVAGECLAAPCAEAATSGGEGAVARPTSFHRPFHRPFRPYFHRPFPIRRGRRGGIRHRFVDCGGRVLPTSLPSIEVWS
jgi:hypothetical protein